MCNKSPKRRGKTRVSKKKVKKPCPKFFWIKTIYLQIQVAQQGPGRIIIKQNDKTCYKKFLKKTIIKS